MKYKINGIYKKILKAIIFHRDPIEKYYGRPTLYNYDYCLKYILMFIQTGLSWYKLGKLCNAHIEAVRKRYYKWIHLNVFYDANQIIFHNYKNNYKSTSLFIDSTVIPNATGSLNSGYSITRQNFYFAMSLCENKK